MFRLMNKIAHSYLYDVVGLIIVIGGCAASGYFGETLSITPAWKMNSAFAHLFPAGMLIGLISVISAVFSLESDRFESRLSNVGNWIGIPSIVLTMFVDIMFGNAAAWITYPITMIIQIIAVRVWSKSKRYEVSKPLRGARVYIALVVVTAICLVFSYAMNSIGFQGQHNIIFWTTTFAFAVSLIANLAEMLKMQFNNKALQFNNKAWVIYNLIQLAKAVSQGNIANICKIIYYLGNNAVSIVSWSAKGRSISSKTAKV